MRLLPKALASLVCVSCLAAPLPPADLAKKTYKSLESFELFLGTAIQQNNKDDYARFIWHPVVALREEWPRMRMDGDPYIKYARCKFAADEFLTYSDDQFKARGKLSKDAPSYKFYFKQKQLCAAALKGKL